MYIQKTLSIEGGKMKCADCNHYRDLGVRMKKKPVSSGYWCNYHESYLQEDALIDEEAERNCVGFERKTQISS